MVTKETHLTNQDFLQVIGFSHTGKLCLYSNESKLLDILSDQSDIEVSICLIVAQINCIRIKD